MDMRRSYYQDIRLFKSGTRLFWFLTLMALLVLIPFVTSDYNLYLINTIAINVIVALGLDLLMGRTGQVSLGHAGFVAIGAYGTVLLILKLGLPFPLALPCAGLIAAGFGFLLGLPALRLEGPYLAIATLGFGMAVVQIIGRWSLFGGHMGLQTPEMTIGPLHIEGDRGFYWVIIPLTVFMGLAARNLMRTRIGRAFLAIRDSEIAAQTLGINIARTKTLAFALSAFYAGIAGGLWAFVLGYINPGMFDFFLSILFMAMVVVGGSGYQAGAVMGAVLITLLNLKLQNVNELPGVGRVLEAISREWMSMAGLANVSFVLFGMILIAVVLFEPLGLYGFWLRIRKYWQRWPF